MDVSATEEARLGGGWVSPGALGVGWVAVQAVVVVLLAELQWLGSPATRPARSLAVASG